LFDWHHSPQSQRRDRILSIPKFIRRAFSRTAGHIDEHSGFTDSLAYRSELLSAEQLIEHARSLASFHTLATDRPRDLLLPRLNENEQILVETHDLLAKAAQEKRPLAPGAEWLLDNFYLIEEQIQTARLHFPRTYSKDLPRLANGADRQCPRVYSLVMEMISHTDGKVDTGSHNGVLNAYQSIAPLKLGELWAVPIMLRLALIENLRRHAVRLSEGRRDQDIAAEWAEKFSQVVEQNPSELILVLADMVRSDPKMSGAFLAEFTRHLQLKSSHLAFANSWLEHRVATQGFTLEQLVLSEAQTQAANQISIGNSITSLRFLSSNDWRDFVEQHSVVESVLQTDPAQAYAGMTFTTRNSYRQVVETLARRSELSEAEVASQAVQLAKDASESTNAENRTAHVGYYLVDDGRAELEKRIALRQTYAGNVYRVTNRYPLFFYLFTAFLFAILVSVLSVSHLEWWNESTPAIAILAIPFLLCSLHLGIGLTNWVAILFVRPRPLPRMDYSEGIPPELRTMIVIPTMISNPAGIHSLLEGLEIRYLANRELNLHFGLLTDFEDADQAVLPSDAELLRLTDNGIRQLNLKYAHDRNDLFFLFHRPRRWNAQELRWMGHERKRGKLIELNELLRGPSDRFTEIIGDRSVLLKVRYVITLDTDTELPRDSARELIGTMAHPLNRPVYDSGLGRVTAGYGILQPRIGVSLPSSQQSWFVRIFAGDSGIDPYTRVVSDVYQDLFGEGSFTGKGIYDVDAFAQCCSAFPDNTVLSHDLIESAYARSALVSDVELYEDYPSRYAADVSRRHRWMRGDWQLVSWLVYWLPGFSHRVPQKPISALSWWKLFDNLRRSVMPIAMLVLLLGAWFLLTPTGAGIATGFVLIVMTALPLLASARELIAKPVQTPLVSHIAFTLNSLGNQLVQSLIQLVLLPYEAMVCLDATVRTLVRVYWTNAKMLEWKTSSDAHRGARTELLGFFRSMWIGPALATASFILLLFAEPFQLIIAGPWLVFWMMSPIVAWWLSRTLKPTPTRLTEHQRVFLAKLSRRTWRYFEDFVTVQENWLPPDNIQEHPALAIASRTSPTNIGMALLSDLAAYDFGYCSAGTLLERTRRTFGTLDRLERYRGHFFNWYDTRTLQPLLPRYVSTVDSGNLVGCLFVFRSGLLELIDAPLVRAATFHGLKDTLQVLIEVAQAQANTELLQILEPLEHELDLSPETGKAAELFLEKLVDKAVEMIAIAGKDEELLGWAKCWERGCLDHCKEFTQLLAWHSLPAAPPVWIQDHEFQGVFARLASPLTLREIAELQQTMVPILTAIASRQSDEWLLSVIQAVSNSSRNAVNRIQNIERAAGQCLDFSEIDFGFLFDPDRDLFTIGYSLTDHRLDNSYYDLLASEARLTSYLAVAMGQVSQEHWFALGRKLTSTGGATTLLSWSGSMFEYLMPLLLMPNYPNTLLDQTYKAVVRRQWKYGQQRGVPWGISESGYSMMDQNLIYQYRAFGVPGLGLKRGLVEDLVVAPYATALALMVAPEMACQNLERLVADGQQGEYGLYEAIDYTPSRLPVGVQAVVVRQFMAHHQGMSLLAIAYLLLNKPMQRRFDAMPMLRAADLLLQERVPKSVIPIFPHVSETNLTKTAPTAEFGFVREFSDKATSTPEVQLLSNGRYQVVVTSTGGGYSRCRDLAVTRWREDATRDHCGSFCYLRDTASGHTWSTTFQPTMKPAKRSLARFTPSRAEFIRSDYRIDTHTEISVSPEDDMELRRITITNRNKTARTIELTSYAEVVLALQAQDLSHPAFSNLFVQTELIREKNTIICTRRPRSAEEKPPWMMAMLIVRGATAGEVSYETDRMKFIGRGRTLANPAAMERTGSLSNTAGAVLDPIVSQRLCIHLEPQETLRVDLVIGVADSREAVMAMAAKYFDPNLANRVLELAWTHSQILLRQLNTSETDAQLYCQLAGSIIYASALRRSPANILMQNRRGQSSLWSYGISGDLPIVLLRIRESNRLDLVRQFIRAHSYWRTRGLAVDLVIWNEDDSVYRQTLQDSILDLVTSSSESAIVDKPGGIFVRRGEQMAEEDRILLLSVARVVLTDEAGTFSEQVQQLRTASVYPPKHVPTRRTTGAIAPLEIPKRDLAFFNGLGGFSHDGREYAIILPPGKSTPAPWINVIANSQFGTIVSESGSSYSWAENSHEFRLTPWHNDAVSDPSGEAIYLRDEETGRYWSPTPSPARGQNSYLTRHGFGYTIFESIEEGIAVELIVFVATDAPVKFLRMKITNRSGRARTLSVTAYWEWVLGELRNKSLMHVTTEMDHAHGTIFVRNRYSPEFASRVAFVDCSEKTRTITCDRTEFIGRNGTLACPAAMGRIGLSGRVGAGFDPCAAIQTPIFLDEGREKEIVFLLGAADGYEEAYSLAQRFRGTVNAQRTLEGVWHYWSRTLGVMYCETPDPTVNFLANGWLIYQTLACRMWARTGFYQSGGAFGFRDQLQDAMALVHAEPQLFREQLLRAAAHQFREGDVQHWWHPPVGRGVRTHFSDDYLWLPLAVSRYVSMTGDTGALDERIPFLTANLLRPEEESNYDLPRVSEELGTLYEHCVRAIQHGLRYGEHGLPLIGCGDWNDGMNLIGKDGKGESVWLAFFLYDVLMQFSKLAHQRGDDVFVAKCLLEAERLRANIEEHGWDGEWYRRAYFDDGTPLGSKSNTECQIDSISQSWSVLSGAGSNEKMVQAMTNLDRRLVRREERLIQLLDPPFDTSDLNPGYIKGYVPGVRENGGQYTHAAIWAVMAFAEMGETEKAWELFRLINPMTHGDTSAAISTYCVEPYVVAADVYAVPPHTGRGGWTWYTGSAGWMYRLITESLLGIRLEVDKLRFAPRVPAEWQSYKIYYVFRETTYHITVESHGSGNVVKRVRVDGVESDELIANLVDDRIAHEILVEIW